MTWTIDDPKNEGLEYYYKSTVGYCGYDRVDGTARQLTRRTSRIADQIVEAAQPGGDI